ncbi:MAG: DUF1592 domain-containing protein [Pirellulaceae bacterium]
MFADGTYEGKARLKFDDDKEERKIPVALLVDGEEVERFEVGTSHHTFRLDHEFTGGEHEITLHFVEDPYSEKKRSQRRVDVSTAEIEGPRDAEPALPLAHRRLFTAYPNKEKSLEQAAEEIFRPLLRRWKFRRNVEESKCSRGQYESSWPANWAKATSKRLVWPAIDLGLAPLLVSCRGDDPLRVAHGRQGRAVAPTTKTNHHSQPPSEPLDDFALPSQLSFFLWSSIPDDELLDLASQGKLCEPRTLQSRDTHVGRST